MTRAFFASLVVTLLLSVPALSAQSKASSSATPPPVVNLNSATAAQIATLPGVGQKAAERIIEYREKNGGFKKVEELMNVKGIGEKSFLKLKALVTVGEIRSATK